MTHQPPTVGSTEAKLERLRAQLADAVATLVTGDDWVRALEFAARFRSRSFNNTLLIWMQHLAAFEQGRVAEPTPTYVAGFRQWRTLGRSVDRGQIGYMIFAPILARFAQGLTREAQRGALEPLVAGPAARLDGVRRVRVRHSSPESAIWARVL